jgi:hypothetical protein
MSFCLRLREERFGDCSFGVFPGILQIRRAALQLIGDVCAQAEEFDVAHTQIRRLRG